LSADFARIFLKLRWNYAIMRLEVCSSISVKCIGNSGGNKLFAEGTEVAVAVDAASQGWTVEVKIPWATIDTGFSDPNILPGFGDESDFSVVAIDKDIDETGADLSGVFAMLCEVQKTTLLINSN